MKKIYLLILGLIATIVLNAQVTVTAPSATAVACPPPASSVSAFAPLGNITIQESAVNDISGSGTFILTAPGNFRFQTPGTVTATSTGGDLTLGAVTIGGGGITLTFTITVNSTINLDVITISGIQVRDLMTPSATQNILRTGGTATVLGDATGAGINHGTLSSQIFAPPVATAATGITCTATNLNWNASLSATSYRLDLSIDPAFGSFIRNGFNVGNVTTFSQTGLTPGTTYYYRLRSNNAVCGTTVANSNVISFATLTASSIPVADPGTGASCNQITANWEVAANATTYLLDVATDVGFTTFVTGYNGLDVGNVTTKTITGLTPGTTYFYRVRGSNGCGASANSATITYATLAALPAPAATAATALACTGFTANWGTVAGTTNYFLDVSTDNAFGSFVGAYNNFDASTSTSVAITGLTAGTTYYYRVRAGNSCGSSISSNVITAITLDIPAAPVATAGTTATCTQITANWGASANATGYFLDVSADPAFGSFVGTYNNLNVGNVVTLNITGLTTGTTYYYRVRATDACGTSVSSNVITYATLDVPVAPVAAAGSGATCTQITANWNASANAIGYRLDVSTDPGFIAGSFVGVYNNFDVGNVLTRNVAFLTSGLTYYYRVRAYNACGVSTSSNVMTYATLLAAAIPVADPATLITCSTATVNWEAAANATGYRLDVSIDPAFGSFVSPYNGNNLGGANVTTFNIVGLAGGTQYYYRVRATNGCGTSANSNVVTFTTSTAIPVTPGPINSPVNTCAGTAGNVFSITAVPGATSYTWTVTGTGWSIPVASTTTSVTVTIGTGVGTVNVTANNNCGSSTAQTTGNITPTTIPATPAAITPPVNTCAGTAGNVFSITAVPGATSYTWTVTGTGWSIPVASTTTSVTVTIGTGIGTVNVTANNNCGSSTAQTTGNITPTTIPATPGAITPPVNTCAGTAGNVFSIAAVPGATSYTWTVTGTGWSIPVASTTTSVTVTIGTGIGTVNVTANNNCGISTAQTTGSITPTTIPATPGAITQPVNTCAGTTSNVFSIIAVPGATSYTWTVTGTGWSIPVASTTTSVTVSIGTGPGTVNVTANNNCGSSSAQTTGNITPTTIPATPGAITPPINTCAGTAGNVFSITAVPGATSYTWTVTGTGWSIPVASTTTSVTVSIGTGVGTVNVTANNNCGNSTAQTTGNITPTTIAATPGAITQPVNTCAGTTGNVFSIIAVAGATSYTWTVTGTGWSIPVASTTTSVTVTIGTGIGTVNVTANNNCGISTAQTTGNITPTTIPATPGAITQPVNTCAGTTGNVFSITAVPGATSYTWSVTGTGWSIPVSSTTTSVTVTIGSGIGAVNVTANNNCGSSAAQTTSNITPTTIPATPGTIAQPVNKCASATGNVFSITAVPGATSYTWTVTGTGWSIPVASTTTSVTVTIGSGIGTVNVTANNNCGNSTAQTTGNITPTTIPATPGTITQPTNKCAGSIGNVFSITAVSGATSYTWTVTGTGWSIPVASTTTSVTVTIGTGIGAVNVTANNNCGSSTAQTTGNITPATVPAQPGTFTTTGTLCIGSSQTYTVTNVAGVTYNWTFPAGWTQTGGTTTNSITVTVGTGAGNVIVTPSNVCGNGTPRTLAVTPNTPPTAGAITGAAAVCIGANITLTPNPTGTAPFTYTWTSSNTTTASITNAGVVLGKAVGSTNITYTVTDANGCSATSAIFVISVTKPTANAITQASGITTICVNSTVSLTSNATGTGTLTYTWASSNNPKATVSNTGVVTGVAAGTANITYTVTDGNGCSTTSAPYGITVNAIPTGTFAATETSGIANNDGIICAGDNVTFTAPAGYGAYTFKVNGTTIQGPNLNNIFNTSSLTNGQSVTVDVANSLNCGTTFGPIVITVNALPVPTLGADKISVCPGDNVTFTASGGTKYNFKVNSASVQSGASPTFSTTTLAVGSNSITVDVTNSSGCIATSPAVVVTVHPLPAGTLSASPSTTICSGDNITFTATAGIGNTYNFKVNGGSVQNTAANTFSSNTLTNGQVVTVDVTNSNGCTAPFGPQQVINVNPLPTGTVTASENSGTPNDNSICANEPVTFTFGNNGYSNYKFFVNAGAAVQNGTSNSYTTSALQPGDVVTVQVSAGSCTATFTAPTITIVPSPTGTLAVSPSNTVCAGDPVTFTATSGGTGNTYNFNVNGSPQQNGTSNTYTTTSLVDGDVVTVDVTNTNSCVSTLNAITMVVRPLPTGTLLISETSGNTNNDGIICTGASVTFTAPNGFANYDFQLNGASIQNGASKTYTTTTLADGDKVTVAVSNGTCIGLLNEYTITVHPLPTVAPITGANNVCLNATITLSDADAGPNGVWSSLNPAIATVDAAGVVTGKAIGAATINFTLTNANGCSAVASSTITVNPLPTVSPITGNTNVCTSTSSQLNDLDGGGAWDTDNPAVATVDPVSGLVNGISAGTATISYTITNGNGCKTTVTTLVTVTTLPVVAPITTTAPSFDVCKGGTIPLKDATSGGTWSSDNTPVATVNSSGVVTGVTSGTANISYSITTSCSETVSATVTITVHDPPSATIAYPGGPFCTTAAPVSVTQTGTTGGSYSYTGAGTLALAADGTINPGASTGGNYVVTYTVAASGGCAVFTTSANVTITAAPSGTISYSGGPFCTTSAPVNVTSSVIPGGVYSYTGAGTLTLGATGTITPASSTAGTYTVIYTIPASGGCTQFTTQTTVIINAAPSATISYTGGPFCSSPGSITVTRTGTSGGQYTSTSGLSVDVATGAINTGTSTPGTYTVTYTIAASGGCGVFTTTTPVTITAGPTAVAGTPISTCSNSGPVNITAGSSATNQSGVLWSSSGTPGTITNANSLTTATYTPSVADIAAGSVTLTLTSNGNGTCTPATSTKLVTINPVPATVIITPTNPSICLGTVQPLTASVTGTSTGSMTFSSGTNVAIPDNSTTGAVSTIAVAGIPAGAVINSVSVGFYITHTSDADLRINLKAPNNNVLNLVDREGGGSNNFGNVTTNTVIGSATGLPTIVGKAAPFLTGPYAPEANLPAVGASAGGGNAANVNLFSSLFGTPNGNWVFSARDLGDQDVGTIMRWTITINYTISTTPLAVKWTPATDLYTDPAATIAYTGTALSTVYAKPATSGSKVYTATSTSGAGCSVSSNVTLNVNPSPSVTITANYCATPGKVRLTANPIPAGAALQWSTGETTTFIDVDIANLYKVVATSGGCSAIATIGVAQELVTNGDFSNGNTGFTSDYAYKMDVAGNTELVDDSGNNGYSISTSGQNVHTDFWGYDHTTGDGTGNFMLVNGHGNTLVVWKETVTVLPNTTYYFSAWAMSLNPAGNNAQLQFSVNGTLTGTTAVLANHCRNCSPGSPNDNWIRFYGTWTSGPTTTSAVIYINDLQPALNGNDFGLDDVSFGTLSTFITLESDPGTDAQTICANTPLTDIVYSVGNGNPTGPTVTGLPAGVTSAFDGDQLTISGTPTAAPQTYTYTITTTGCSPYSVTGTITVQGQKITLSSGSASPSICVNAAMSNIVFTLGGTATGASTTGLPAGVSGVVSGTSYTISGTPTVAGSYPYTITTTGTCTPVTATGTITVQSQTITLNSANAAQTVCINAPIANIQYTVGGTGNNASATGLPPGVTGTYSGGLFIISGSPTSGAGSPYTYTVTTTGPSCAGATITGTITVTPAAIMTLTSGAGTNPQTGCKGTPITAVTYSVNGATGAGVTGLPAGVTGVFNAGVFTISGTPTVGGVFNYTITTTGGCGSATAMGTLTIQAQTISLTSGAASPSLCANTVLPNIVFTIGGTATSATVSGLPAGVSGSLSGNAFTISGTPTGPAGPYAYTVTTSGTCGAATAGGTITVSPAPVGGNLTSVLICSGASGNITLSGQSGNIVRWEVSTDNGMTWTPITNITITQSYTNVTVPTQYRAVVTSSGCSTVFSTVATLSIHNLWTGATSTDWNVATNWSGNALPSISCPDVYIPGAPTNQPILSSGTGTINNLHILGGATLKVTGSGTLQIAGTISNAGTFDARTGAIELNGSSPQAIAIGTFMNNAVHDLVISNSNAAGVALNGPLDVYHSLTYGPSGTQLVTNNNLTLKSTATETAWLGDMTGHTITGNVTVERYIPARSAWRFLSVPTQPGQTIHVAWQENQPANSTTPIGFGTQITSDRPTWAADGFDMSAINGPSMKSYNPGTNDYTGIATTNAAFAAQALGGYMTFVRGDRTVNVFGQAATSTVLRTKGLLYTGTQTPITVIPGQITPYNNPYAAPLDLRKISQSLSVFFYVWDPNRGGAHGLGAFQTLSWDGSNYKVLPGGSISYPGDIGNFIESGQAFLVSGGAATLPLTEAKKGIGSGVLVFRPANEPQQQLRTNLFSIDADSSAFLADGVLNIFDDTYSNDVDGMDAKKLANFGENLSIRTGGKLLVIERKHTITSQDTIFLNLTRVRAQAYQFRFSADNIKTGIEGFLEDNYMHTRTPLDLSGSTIVNFTVVNIAGSYAPDRFRIVFAPAVVLPVTFTSIKAYRVDQNINVEWRVENEMNIKQYEVEKSINGIQFTTLAVVAATANNGNSAVYLSADTRPVEGYNYYRVKSVDINGKTAYTGIVKVLMGSQKKDITIYPNPITDGMIHLQFQNQPGGKYGIRLLNKIGQVIMSKQISHVEGSSTELIKWNYNLAHGMYQLEVTKPDGGIKDINVLY